MSDLEKQAVSIAPMVSKVRSGIARGLISAGERIAPKVPSIPKATSAVKLPKSTVPNIPPAPKQGRTWSVSREELQKPIPELASLVQSRGGRLPPSMENYAKTVGGVRRPDVVM